MEISNLRPVHVYSTSTNVLKQALGKFLLWGRWRRHISKYFNPLDTVYQTNTAGPRQLQRRKQINWGSRNLNIPGIPFGLLQRKCQQQSPLHPERSQKEAAQSNRKPQIHLVQYYKGINARTHLCQQTPALQLGCVWTIPVSARMMLRHLWLSGANEPDIFDDSGDSRGDWASISMPQQSGGGLSSRMATEESQKTIRVLAMSRGKEAIHPGRLPENQQQGPSLLDAVIETWPRVSGLLTLKVATDPPGDGSRSRGSQPPTPTCQEAYYPVPLEKFVRRL